MPTGWHYPPEAFLVTFGTADSVAFRAGHLRGDIERRFAADEVGY